MKAPIFILVIFAAFLLHSCKGYNKCDYEPFSLLYQYPEFYCGESASGEGIRLYGFNITAETAKAVFLDLLPFQYIEEVIINAVNNHYTANFIGNVTAAVYLDISCVNANMPLVIDSTAFSHTASVTKILGVGVGCDVSRLNWSFASTFTNLEELNLGGNNFLTTFYTLPSASLTTVTAFGLYGEDLEKGLVNFSVRYPEPLKQGLSRLSIRNNKNLSDFAINCFLIKWITKYSRNSLISIDLSGNNLTKIPNEIRNYNNLEAVNIYGYGGALSGNLKPWTIQKDAFKLTTYKYKYLILSYGNITAIEPGAFQGNYANGSNIYLENNHLKTLDAGAFKTILQQMSQSGGYIQVENNPFDCSSLKSLCNLAWLIRDNPSYMTDYNGGTVRGARCANGTNFQQLNTMALRFPICP